MLSSIIIQDVATNFLKIIRFETSYWEWLFLYRFND
jgi:hypothetical protein